MPLNRNARLTLVYTFLMAAARSIFMQQILSTFVYAIAGGRDTAVGYTSGAQGLAMLLSSIPGGILADRLPRHTVLRISAAVGTAAAVLLSVSFWKGSMLFCYIGSVSWGTFMGLSTGAVEAAFADGVESGKRSFIYAVGQALGPGATILMFAGLGNTWTVGVMRVVLLVGTAAAVPALATLLFFHDRHALPDSAPLKAGSRSLSIATTSSRAGLSLPPASSSALRSPREQDTDPSGSDDGAETAASGLKHVASDAYDVVPDKEGNEDPVDTLVPVEQDRPGLCGQPPWVVVTAVFMCSDTVVACGAGMTVKFFPLFFAHELGLSPVQVSIVYTLSPLVTAVCAMVTQWVGKCIGRGTSIFIMKAIGTACLFGLVFLDNPLACSALFILRTGIMNSTVGLEKSILMDIVPKSLRAKVNSVEGFITFSWTGSAVLGGLLVAAHGYRFCFFVTACVYTVGTLIMLVGLPMVPPEHEETGEPLLLGEEELEDQEAPGHLPLQPGAEDVSMASLHDVTGDGGDGKGRAALLG